MKRLSRITELLHGADLLVSVHAHGPDLHGLVRVGGLTINVTLPIPGGIDREIERALAALHHPAAFRRSTGTEGSPP